MLLRYAHYARYARYSRYARYFTPCPQSAHLCATTRINPHIFNFFEKKSHFPCNIRSHLCYNSPMVKSLNTPKGITVQQAAAILRYSESQVRRMIAAGDLVAWKPRGPRGRLWLVDEIALASVQKSRIARARHDYEAAQAKLMQLELF